MELNSVIPIFPCRTGHISQDYETDLSHAWLLLVVYWKPKPFLFCLHSKDLKVAVVTRQMGFFFFPFFFIFCFFPSPSRFGFSASPFWPLTPPPRPRGPILCLIDTQKHYSLGEFGFIGHADPQTSVKTMNKRLFKSKLWTWSLKRELAPSHKLCMFFAFLFYNPYFPFFFPLRGSQWPSPDPWHGHPSLLLSIKTDFMLA